jgi:2-polyprenyl-3-methyl-5-hydroxy-6-metoxy-1,4-benzoquinol methylase
MDYRDYQRLDQTKNEHFWYRARRILIDDLLHRTLTTAKPERKIIEIGCGTGIQLPLLAQFGTVLGLDIVPESVAIARQSGFAAQVFNMETESLEESSADVIASFDVLEHLTDDVSALKKIAAALKPQGQFFFSLPAAPWLFGPHDRAAGHYRRYSRREIRAKIAAAGLELQTIGYWNSWMFPAIIAIRIGKKIVGPKNRADSDTKTLPRLLNSGLYQVLKTETGMINRGFKLPWGLSLYGQAIKK